MASPSTIKGTRTALAELGVVVADIASRWDSDYIEVGDPEGNRIELWSPTP